MREIHDAAIRLLETNQPAWVARVITYQGFGGRRQGEVLLVSAEERTGSILGGSADSAIDAAIAGLTESGGLSTLTTVGVGDLDAVAAGLACGGAADVVVQRLDAIPAQLWELIGDRTPAMLVTPLDGANRGATRLLSDSDASDLAEAVSTMNKRGALSSVVEGPNESIVIEHVAPQPHMIVLGDVELSIAIQRQGALLGWTTEIVDERQDGALEPAVTKAAKLGQLDGVVVLSHDIDASCAVLAAALNGRCGYIGALGSRHTQKARANYLESTLGLNAATIGGVHGPVGLDIGARTPAETALAIFAEALTVQRNRSGHVLRDATSAING